MALVSTYHPPADLPAPSPQTHMVSCERGDASLILLGEERRFREAQSLSSSHSVKCGSKASVPGNCGSHREREKGLVTELSGLLDNLLSCFCLARRSEWCERHILKGCSRCVCECESWLIPVEG